MYFRPQKWQKNVGFTIEILKFSKLFRLFWGGGVYTKWGGGGYTQFLLKKMQKKKWLLSCNRLGRKLSKLRSLDLAILTPTCLPRISPPPPSIIGPPKDNIENFINLAWSILVPFSVEENLSTGINNVKCIKNHGVNDKLSPKGWTKSVKFQKHRIVPSPPPSWHHIALPFPAYPCCPSMFSRLTYPYCSMHADF